MSDEKEIPTIGRRIVFNKTDKTFVIEGRYRIYMDEFAQMVYLAMREGCLQLQLVGHDALDDDFGPMKLKLPRDKWMEAFISDIQVSERKDR